MLKKLLISLIIAPLLITFSTAYAGFQLPQFNIVLYYKGYGQTNTFSGPLPQAFNTYCAGVCTPTTQFVATDPTTGLPIAKIYAWMKDSEEVGTTLCFTEFIKYDLPFGSIYTQGNPQGTCGAIFNNSLYPPISSPTALVLGGGGDGNIVAGTGIYSGIKGTYTDRLIVEIGSATYYRGLYFTLAPTNRF